jgi:hypothetical protein
MKKLSNKSDFPNDEKFSRELRAQPRKSQEHMQKHPHHTSDDDDLRHHGHYHEPAKNAVRMQLRSIQRLF